MPHPLKVLLVAFLCSSLACVHNPARQLQPNDELLSVGDDGTLLRGSEALDEEEFYTLTGDTKSAATIHASRSTGETLQSVGMTLLVFGATVLAAGAATWFLSGTGEPPIIPLQEEQRLYPLIGAAVGGVIMGTGIVLWNVVGKPKAAGTELMFDLAHAQSSIETGRYGEQGLTPSVLKTLSVRGAEGANLFCGSQPTELLPLGATDTEGRPAKVDTHPDWFTWTVTPQTAFKPSLEPGKPATLISPLEHSLLDLDQKVTVTVTARETGLSVTEDFMVDLKCGSGFNFSGGAGVSGKSGKDGKSVTMSSGQSGNPGTSGQNGGDGKSGLSVDVEAAYVSLPNHPRLVLLAVSAGGEVDTLLLEPGIEVTVASAGGRGGSGGSGGKGSNGSNGTKGCGNGGNGGTGGDGGDGGRGGDGGSVTLRVSDKELLNVVQASAPGGHGGSAGSRGGGGMFGGSTTGKCGSGVHVSMGKSGQPGQSGQAGGPGRDGQVRRDVVSSSSLGLIARLMQQNPGLMLASADDGDAAPTAKRKRR